MTCAPRPSFRVGTKLGRTLYMKPAGVEAVEVFVGIFDHPNLARYACDAMNARINEGLPPPDDGTGGSWFYMAGDK